MQKETPKNKTTSLSGGNVRKGKEPVFCGGEKREEYHHHLFFSTTTYLLADKPD